LVKFKKVSKRWREFWLTAERIWSSERGEEFEWSYEAP